MNAIKHSLTAEVLLPAGDFEEIQARIEALTLEMKPKTTVGANLITMMATLSLRMIHAAEHEAAATAMRVRHASDAFEDERIDAANALFATLADDPRTALRKLKRTPEGMDRLIDAWTDLRADLAIEPEPIWGEEQVELVANLIGLKTRHAQGSRFGALSRGFRGDFAALKAEDGAGLTDADRRTWCQIALFEAIEAEIAALEAHIESLDLESFAIDRAEAGARALFDTSKPSCLARRYESDARRGYFRALKEFRLVEAEASAKEEAAPTPPTQARTGSTMGSFRQTTPPPNPEPARTFPDASTTDVSNNRGADGEPLRYTPVPKPTV